MRTVRLFFVFFFILFSVFGHAEPMSSIITDLERLSEQGGVEIRFLLSLTLFKGEKIYQDEVFKWMGKQEEYNNEETQKYWRALSSRTPTFEGIRMNGTEYRPEKAISLFRPVSSFLERAREKKNRQRGLKWLKILIEDSYVPAQFEWWRMQNGERGQSERLLRVLAESPYAPAAFELYRLLKEENAEEALNWLEASAKGHYAPAELEMYHVLTNRQEMRERERDGREEEENYLKGLVETMRLKTMALRWLKRAVDQEYREALFQWGIILRDGTNGVKENRETAFDVFMEAALQGHVEAQYNVAYMHRFGIGVTENVLKALTWYRRAMEQESPQAMYDMGMMHLEGVMVKKNENKAVELIWQAAYMGDRNAQYQMGLMFRDGIGVMADPVKAAFWFREAGMQDHRALKRGFHELIVQSDRSKSCNGAFSIRVNGR